MKYLAVSILLLLTIAACAPNRRIMESSQTPAPANSEPAVAGFDEDIRAMRAAGFKYIVVLRRIDGGVIDAEDKSIINANSPLDANRRKLSDEGRAVIIGTNFPFYPGSIGNLAERFALENLSQPEAGPLEVDRFGNSNISSNANNANTVNSDIRGNRRKATQ